jgi:preprotein translocase SecE subunit
MNKVGQWVGHVRGFVGEVKTELLKCNWPTKPELWESTVVVMASVAIVTIAVFFSDIILLTLTRLIIR